MEGAEHGGQEVPLLQPAFARTEVLVVWSVAERMQRLWVGTSVRQVELCSGRGGRGLLDRLVCKSHHLASCIVCIYISLCVYSRISGKQIMVIETQC